MVINKRGFLLGEQTLKIIIAILGILLLIYLLFSLYSNFLNKQKLEQAKASLKLIEQGLKKAEKDGSADVVILNPEGWMVLSWPYNNIFPGDCRNLNWQNCVCICKTPKSFSVSLDFFRYIKNLFSGNTNVQSFANKCDDLGGCIEVKALTKTYYNDENLPFPIYNPPFNLQIKYDKENKQFEIIKK